MRRLTEIEPYLCRPESTIREVMARQNIVAHVFQLVVDENSRFLGTLTDGDIRRGFLKGLSLDSCVREFFNADAVCGVAGEHNSNTALLLVNEKKVRFLPVLSKSSQVVEILVLAEPDLASHAALVMAGGYGRRLGEKTKNLPKPLLMVGGRPILDHVLERLETAGFGRIYIGIHYLGDQIREFIAQRDNLTEIVFIKEDKPLGTAGAIGNISQPLSAPLMVVNGDLITSVDFVAVHEFHIRHGYDATIAVTRHEFEVPFGVVRYGDDGLFAGIDEKPRISNFVAAGLYYISPEFAALVPKNSPIDMPDLLNSGMKIGLKSGLFPIHEYWKDVGHPDDLDTAIRAFPTT